ncbi:hypothetical protein BHM03_00061832 [Ensete ventricosum]|nr:hypothetical protein BHM03_00061832 [Ensete ventricosum]
MTDACAPRDRSRGANSTNWLPRPLHTRILRRWSHLHDTKLPTFLEQQSSLNLLTITLFFYQPGIGIYIFQVGATGARLETVGETGVPLSVPPPHGAFSELATARVGATGAVDLKPSWPVAPAGTQLPPRRDCRGLREVDACTGNGGSGERWRRRRPCTGRGGDDEAVFAL